MNHLWFPPNRRSCQGSTVSSWPMHWVFNTLFHDLVTISDIPLYGFFHLPRSYLEKLVFISTTLFHIKACLCLLQSFYVRWIFISHPSDGYPIHPSLSRITSRSLSWKIHLYHIPHGLWKSSPLSLCSTLQVIYFINLFNNTFAFHTHIT